MPQSTHPETPYDTAEAREVIHFLNCHGVPYRRHTRHHFKIHDLNYYIPSRKVVLDGAERHDLGRGLEALEAALRRSRYISPSAPMFAARGRSMATGDVTPLDGLH